MRTHPLLRTPYSARTLFCTHPILHTPYSTYTCRSSAHTLLRTHPILHLPQFCAAGRANSTGRGPFADALAELDDTVGGTLASLHPAPYTLHPAPCTLHPAPCTLYPAPCSLQPAPCACTLHTAT